MLFLSRTKFISSVISCNKKKKKKITFIKYLA